MAVLHKAELQRRKRSSEETGSLELPADSTGNPAHEMQRLLVDRLGSDLGRRIVAEQLAFSHPLDRAIEMFSRAAGPVGFLALTGWLIWLVC